MVYVTGDTHGDFHRFSAKAFPEQKEMTREDIVIVLGDFGGIWMQQETPEEKYNLNWLNDRPFTLCFIDGNHENYDRLFSDEYPVVDFHGGKAHQIREHVFHLMRSFVFDFGGKNFFVMGGARSHDICDGILDPDNYPDPDAFKREYKRWNKEKRMFRVNHLSWWKQEIPSEDEMGVACSTLKGLDYTVDYVLTHCLPNKASTALAFADTNPLTLFFDTLLDEGLTFTEWHCGHYHTATEIFGKYHVHYYDIEKIL